MFSFFKKKSKVEKLEIQYKKLLEESYKLSHSNRKESDNKRAEAEEILKQIESLTNNN
ncbi:Lacal_2735 family protein [Fulvivirga sediminis]|uniref:Lacal_2735 family protein n=1 Tax=Fulvivirga sediminis TaxID=2803949 RepID=A0A937K1V1_9BACT|nr:Lacal_2735 family protein [Fulvivirga sediminis]MBL3658959.1 Lacal_2735 family protein [Fulvivirga sediminis]